ncbi:MAG: FAD-dependent oxidoreductase [Candidatus Brockarchaeota archaeon]|nr:FAD-dependent oxidoreductase [Candidatus Brockarchaeota archaeon]MBO3768294.1 FAD-dependent oxidoreductase [Candidatus Brockarchaeota archaeon]MBO3801600.1 FAD-dependent oxidoreductase [Candidatus Brockarchaeota archaeon]
MKDPQKVVVIGGGAAGMASAASARRVNKDAKITVIEASKYVSYGSCGIPYYLGNLVDDVSKLVTYTPEQFKKERNVEVLTNSYVTKIKVNSKTIEYISEKGEEKEIEFDSLILATGAKPFIPKMEGLNLRGVYTVRFLEGAAKLREDLASSKKVTIIGAGYIGLELAENFKKLDKEVTILELLPRPMPNVDVEMANIIEQELRKNGVKLELNKKVVGFEGKNRVERVVTEDSKYETDIVVVTVGVRPNVTLAKQIGVELGKSGAIKTNSRMETSIKGIFAAGDNAEAHHIVLNAPAYIPLAQTANKMGYVAGANAAGGSEEFPGIVGSAITKVFDLEIGKTGVSEEEAKRFGIEVRSVFIKSKSRAGYYPEGKDVWIKLILEKSSNIIIGGQIVGYEGVWGRIAALTFAITNKLTPKQVLFSDLPYAPPFSPVWDPLIVASRVALR